MLRCFLFGLALALPAAGCAQSLRFVLRDSASRQPLIGASVGVPGTGLGGTTDATGIVQLTPAPTAGTRLRAAALGYQPRTLVAPAGGGPPPVLLLAPSAAEIDEVVVTATRASKTSPSAWRYWAQRKCGRKTASSPATSPACSATSRAPRFSLPRPPRATPTCAFRACRGSMRRFCAMGCRSTAALRAASASCRCRRSTCGRLSY